MRSESVRDKARAYQRIRQKMMLIHLVLTPVLLALAVATPLSLVLKGWAMKGFGNPLGIVFLYFSFFSVYILFLDFPFALYSGFVLEHRFGLSNQTLWAWGIEFVKRSLLSFALSVVLLGALYGIIWHFPDRWWIIAWAAYASVSYILGKIFPVLIVPLFYRYGKVEDENIRGRILKLCGRYGLSVRNVYSINLSKTTKKANAVFMGFGRTKRVVLSDTLLERFTAEEAETVIAHEIGHFKHRDIWKQLAVGTLASFFAFWIAFGVLDPLSKMMGFAGAGDIAALPLLFLVFYIFYLVLMPVLNGYSRCVERAADSFALKAISNPSVFISCMEKLGDMNLANPNPHPVVEWFFYDHPPIAKRVQMAREWIPETTSEV
jgi:STE24 endopeptidase